MLSLYLPLVFSLVWACEGIMKRLRRRQANVWIMRSYFAAQWILCAAICWRVLEIVRLPRFYEG